MRKSLVYPQICLCKKAKMLKKLVLMYSSSIFKIATYPIIFCYKRHISTSRCCVPDGTCTLQIIICNFKTVTCQTSSKNRGKLYGTAMSTNLVFFVFNERSQLGKSRIAFWAVSIQFWAKIPWGIMVTFFLFDAFVKKIVDAKTSFQTAVLNRFYQNIYWIYIEESHKIWGWDSLN